MASARRIGAPDAKNRAVLLDAAEQLLIEEGYAAVTSRRVAEKAGLKPQLVHYYFRTMDDLFLEIFRRYADQGMEAHRVALASPQPLWALWRFGINPDASRLTMEMAALANHRKALRTEMSRYAELFREQQREVFVTALDRHGVLPSEVPPVVWSILLTGLSTVVMLGEALGVTAGHAETMELVERYLTLMEGPPQSVEDSAHQWRSEQSAPLGPEFSATTTPSTASTQ
ncbi:TetR/AcrR family transcriptional regulator [Mycolicibacterium aichiense]|uniref:TetR family transcriptional regulator n=1 Tax=Mycolicibacterium aichiense TaxID=1799 RepID=A0AAD1HP16_9MYCO|nr:TetR/AcrR family transcriptional regulator [Mycolicibacterium aichiense]MCV7021735.1 TetR/AcrR family transcriptional regulator [Mycolicibacterium aichiense]BBX09012.1 TetR family transcriptional regulator [Mycolicibacterium aichiense]STZ82803.1 transcriptional regulator [Mycolicibacterium aichiense]